MQRVVFVGNCQAQGLADAFNQFIAPFTGQRAFHVGAYRDIDAESRATLESADIIVDLVFDFAQRINVADLGLDKPVVVVPYVNCNFLWPFAYEAHPRNAVSDFSESGPYPAELGDAYLNRLIREEVPAEEAASRYLDLDINQKVRLDRRLEMNLALQRRRDEACGFDVAELMERHFREEPIFLTPYHPTRRIFLHLTQRCFERLGVPAHLIARLPHLVRRSFFLPDALPVHPRLAAHFGLLWANETTRYPVWLDGDFTFAEFIGRYLRFEWCEDFARGHSLARKGRRGEAIPYIRAGLAAYPKADRAWALLSHVLNADGALQGALDAGRRAVEINPREAEYCAHLGNLLTHAGEVAAARAAYERAVALEPEHTPWLRLLALHWERQGKRAEAGALAATLAAKDPLDYELHAQRGHLLAGRGDREGAASAFAHALTLAPHIPDIHAAQSHVLAALGRVPEAIREARAALAEAPSDRDLRLHLGNLLREDGNGAAAEEVFLDAIKHDPDDPEAYRGFARVLAATGRAEAAARLEASIACAFEGAAAPPDEDAAPLAAGIARFEAGDFAAAADAFRAAGESTESQTWLARSESHAGRRLEAVDAAWRAVSLAPHSARHFEHLGHLLGDIGENEKAERVFRRSVQLEPERASALGALSHVLFALGRFAEGAEAAEKALTLLPNNADLWVHLGNLRLRVPNESGATAAFTEALALAPEREDVRQRLTEMGIKLEATTMPIEAGESPASESMIEISMPFLRGKSKARRIAFLGNCQVDTLYLAYRDYVLPFCEDEARYIEVYKELNEDDRNFLLTSDVLVTQKHDFPQKINYEDFDIKAKIHCIPHANGVGIYWPYGGFGHPRQKEYKHYPRISPYGDEYGDLYLNRLIEKKRSRRRMHSALY